MYSVHAIALLCAYMAFICGCMACVGGCMAVYSVGYTVMAYGIGVWVWRVWSVVCTVYVYGVYPLGYSV